MANEIEDLTIQNTISKEFCFQLTDEELKILRFQIGTSNDNNLKNESLNISY